MRNGLATLRQAWRNHASWRRVQRIIRESERRDTEHAAWMACAAWTLWVRQDGRGVQ